MKLVGATWLRATTDDYVTYRRVAIEPTSESALCAAYPGYGNPCPNSGSTMGPTSESTRALPLMIVGLTLNSVCMAFPALR
ncbi:hypothetical protein DPMN_005857 [Dreissena polymorpha]|uniref:Uncharacterized protein n=1 Tax=Dreissena polymorpha TaxID=45954 RepID=A0A9D4MR62_DREPO|nr:hypothetical protein DPMN_134509 [Dreissena polymorpha]KAH3806194.1 hypothetical protein DPMN_134511 [Dreissena polymorpha]KAH3881930.1 hypothetical protein DPMN_005857 [Dreissena polymorpha]